MRHDILDDIATLRGSHPSWCAKDHRCDYDRGGMHRSIPEEWALSVGKLTSWREGRRRGYFVMQWSTPIAADEAAQAGRVQRALAAFQRSLLGEP